MSILFQKDPASNGFALMHYFTMTKKFPNIHTRGGVEDTRLETKAKDTKKIRGQGQRPRTQMQVFSKGKRS